MALTLTHTHARAPLSLFNIIIHIFIVFHLITLCHYLIKYIQRDGGLSSFSFPSNQSSIQFIKKRKKKKSFQLIQLKSTFPLCWLQTALQSLLNVYTSLSSAVDASGETRVVTARRSRRRGSDSRYRPDSAQQSWEKVYLAEGHPVPLITLELSNSSLRTAPISSERRGEEMNSLCSTLSILYISFFITMADQFSSVSLFPDSSYKVLISMGVGDSSGPLLECCRGPGPQCTA